MKNSEKKYPKYPSECTHPITRREYKPNAQAPKMIICLDCGAILFMAPGAGGGGLHAVAVPLAAYYFMGIKP